MARKASRRLLVFLAAFGIALVPITAQPVPAAAPSDGTLYAARGPWQIVTLDPASGAQTLVEDWSPQPGVSSGHAVGPLFADARSPRLYDLASICFCNGKGGFVIEQIATIDTTTNSASFSPDLAQLTGSAVAFDQSTGTLWSVTWCYGCTTVAVVSIDPSTGSEATVTTVPNSYPWDYSMVAAPRTHTLYLTLVGAGGPHDLIAVNAQTGDKTFTPALAQPLRNLVYDSSSQALFGFTDSTPSQLVRIDTQTGAEAVVATIAAGLVVDSPTMVPGTHTIIGVARATFPSPTRIATINDHSGAVTLGATVPDDINYLAFQRLRGKSNPQQGGQDTGF